MSARENPPIASGHDAPLIFLHIPKTAGSTLRELLTGRFDPSATYIQPFGDPRREREYVDGLRGGPPPSVRPLTRDPDLGYLTDLALLPRTELARLRLLVGHFWFGLHELLPGSPTYVTLLRDPVDRVLSLYHHRVRHQGLDVRLERYVEMERDFELDNGQTRRLAAKVTRSSEDMRWVESSGEMLRLAIENIDRHFFVVGLTERFRDVAALLAHSLGWRDVSYAAQNTGEGRSRREDLPPRLLARIEEHNRLDRELYAFAERLLESRLRDDGIPVPSELRRVGHGREHTRHRGAIRPAFLRRVELRRQPYGRLGRASRRDDA